MTRFSATNWWTRSPNMNNSNNVWNVNSDGNYNNWNYNNTYGVRPALMEREMSSQRRKQCTIASKGVISCRRNPVINTSR